MEKTNILSIYRQWMIDRWRDRHMTLDEVRALKVFCAVHSIAPEEHESIASEVDVPARELTDEENMSMNEWLRSRRKVTGPTGTSLSESTPSWALNLPSPPQSWHNRLAVMAVVIIVGGMIALVVVQ